VKSKPVDPRVVRTRELALNSARALLLEGGIGSLSHLNVAEHSGLGRKTVYRHWPTASELIYETFSSANFPQADRTGDLRPDLLAHLEALRRALVDGPLVYLIHALNERAANDPDIAELRDRLTNEGCEPIRIILRTAVKAKHLPRIDIEEAASQLEGPLFYRTLVRNEAVPHRTITKIVDHFLNRFDTKTQAQ
jgi:AcrR family transcriptional regulator